MPYAGQTSIFIHHCLCSALSLIIAHFFLDDECTVTDNGLVHSFDGITQVAPPEFLSVLSSSNLDFADECNFENRIRMEVHVSH